MNDSITDKLSKLGVFPIIVINRADQAAPLGEALMRAGLPCAEVTFRTDAAAEAIETLSKEFPEMLVGAGTVLSNAQVDAAVSSGARFILAPGFNPGVVDYCLERGVTIYPGVCTPTDIEAAMVKGLRVLKFFPAEAIGGLSYLKAISAPLSMVGFLPTGGITLSNLKDYLLFDKVVGCAGTWIVRKEWLTEGDFTRIEKEAAAAVALVQEVRGGA